MFLERQKTHCHRPNVPPSLTVSSWQAIQLMSAHFCWIDLPIWVNFRKNELFSIRTWKRFFCQSFIYKRFQKKVRCQVNVVTTAEIQTINLIKDLSCLLQVLGTFWLMAVVERSDPTVQAGQGFLLNLLVCVQVKVTIKTFLMECL